MISRGVRGRPVPRRVLPADGVGEAWEELLRARAVLEAHGLGGPDEPEPAALGPRVRCCTFEVDETVAEWITALGEMARRRVPQRRREKGRAKKKGKRR
jgi:hypothetical protein